MFAGKKIILLIGESLLEIKFSRKEGVNGEVGDNFFQFS